MLALVAPGVWLERPLLAHHRVDRFTAIRRTIELW